MRFLMVLLVLLTTLLGARDTPLKRPQQDRRRRALT